MHHRVDLLLLEQVLHGIAVAQVEQVELDALAGQFLDPAERVGARVAQVVQHHDLVARFQQFQAGVRADIAGAAGDQDAEGCFGFGYISYLVPQL